MSVATMRNTLSNREFHGWLAYFDEPIADIPEVQMATLTMMVAQGLGAKDVKHSDYLIRKPEKPIVTKDERPSNGTLTKNEVMSVFAGMATPLEG